MTDFESFLHWMEVLAATGILKYTFCSTPDVEHIITARYSTGAVVAYHFDEDEKLFARAEY